MIKMKVGILSFHEVVNPGAFLQTLGTQQLLKRLGHAPLIIDYTAPAHRFSTQAFIRKNNLRMVYRWRMLLDMREKARVFEAARNKHFRLTQPFKKREDIRKEALDAIVIGSDIVWNYQMPELGSDPVYFGKELETKRLVSFAASFGNCKPSDKLPDYVSTGLRKFSSVSVRDQNSAEIVMSATGKPVPVVCDPAFHFELPKEEDRETLRPYLLVYLVPKLYSKELKEQVITLARRHNLRIVSCYHRHLWADQTLMDIDPHEWIQLIRGASFIVTNTFHGSIFSIRLQKKFALELNPSVELKTAGIIKSTGLQDRIFQPGSKLEQMAGEEIDFSAADQYSQVESKRAEDWLQLALLGD